MTVALPEVIAMVWASDFLPASSTLPTASLSSAEKGGQAAGGPSFSALLKDAVGSVLDAGKKSDAQTMAMSSGKANVMDVVTAVAETDVAVSTLVSVRDRVIQSYEDIMKMPI